MKKIKHLSDEKVLYNEALAKVTCFCKKPLSEEARDEFCSRAKNKE